MIVRLPMVMLPRKDCSAKSFKWGRLLTSIPSSFWCGSLVSAIFTTLLTKGSGLLHLVI